MEGVTVGLLAILALGIFINIMIQRAIKESPKDK